MNIITFDYIISEGSIIRNFKATKGVIVTPIYYDETRAVIHLSSLREILTRDVVADCTGIVMNNCIVYLYFFPHIIRGFCGFAVDMTWDLL